MRTVRNPPTALLAEECRKGLPSRNRSAVPYQRFEPSLKLRQKAHHESTAGARESRIYQYVGISSRRETPRHTSGDASIECLDGCVLAHGSTEYAMEHMDGWGSANPGGPHSVYPSSPLRDTEVSPNGGYAVRAKSPFDGQVGEAAQV